MNKLLKASALEICFFSMVFIAFPILTSYEYVLYERTSSYPSLIDLLERLIYGVLKTIPYWLYYRLILPILFEKRYGSFVGWCGLFLLLLDNYTHYVVYGLVKNLWFLPELLLISARRYYSSSVILHFSIVYILRELIMVSALGYYRQSVAQRQRLHELIQRQLQVELDSLKTQLQPHFFFNTLNNIYSLALQQSTKTAPLIARHADIMRYILYGAKHRQVPLTEEVKFLTDYIAVESVRFSDQATIQFDTQNIHDRVCIEPLLLLPFIENTFKHGLRQDIHGGFVQIILVLIETELLLETRNSKIHAGHSANADSGIGLRNSVKQLSLLYPHHHTLSVENGEHSYTLRLQINLRSHDELSGC
ncbi:sensor histidine kinase [Spirosoma linguale]